MFEGRPWMLQLTVSMFNMVTFNSGMRCCQMQSCFRKRLAQAAGIPKQRIPVITLRHAQLICRRCISADAADSRVQHRRMHRR